MSRGYLGNEAVASSAGSSGEARQAERQYLLQEIDLAQKQVDRFKGLGGEDGALATLLDLKRQLAALDAEQPVASTGAAREETGSFWSRRSPLHKGNWTGPRNWLRQSF